MEGCEHEGFHTAQGRYNSETLVLRYVVVCDTCHKEMREVLVQRYTPAFDPRGNDVFVKG